MTVPASPARKYHHGQLEQALVTAAVALVEEQGLAAVSVREVARRAGVSPGAPFRHFASKAALMTAVAEQAMARLSQAVQDRLAALDDPDPISQLTEMGRAYVDWVVANPTHFLIISSRSEIDFSSSPLLLDQNEALRQTMIRLLRKAKDQERLHPDLNLDDLVLSLRALTYGAARLWADGHFPQWQVARDPAAAMRAMIELFLTSITRSRSS
jgi:AcrR family transcriptional regulator